MLGTIIAGIVCLVAFVKRQRTLEEPLLDLRCLKSSDFTVAAIVVTLINAACLVTNTLLPILLQTAMGASALETGIVMLPAAAAGILISPISGIVFDKFGPRTISVGGLVLMTAALFALSRMNANSSIVLVAVLCAAQAVGQSLANMPVNTWGINALPNDKIAHGNAIANTGRQVDGACRDPYDERHRKLSGTRHGNRSRNGSRNKHRLYGVRSNWPGRAYLRRAEDTQPETPRKRARSRKERRQGKRIAAKALRQTPEKLSRKASGTSTDTR